LGKPRKGERQDHSCKSMFKEDKDRVAFYESTLTSKMKVLNITDDDGEE